MTTSIAWEAKFAMNFDDLKVGKLSKKSEYPAFKRKMDIIVKNFGQYQILTPSEKD